MAYTPIFEELLQQGLSLTDTAVFGAVWRFAQDKLGKSTAGPKRIGKRIGVTHNTVRTSLKRLCGLGLLEDLTPEVRHAPHHFRPTSKALTLINKEDRLPNFGNLEDEVTKNRLPTTESRLPNSGKQVTNDWQPRLPNSGNEERSKETSKKQSKKHVGGKPRQPSEKQKASQEMFGALIKVCKVDLNLITAKDRGRFNQAEKKMRDKKYGPQDVYDFEQWWLDNDWRGQRGQPPTLTNLRETWGQFLAGVETTRNGANNGSHQTSTRKPGPGHRGQSGLSDGLRAAARSVK